MTLWSAGLAERLGPDPLIQRPDSDALNRTEIVVSPVDDFQNALDRLREVGGGDIKLKAGTYLVDNDLNVPSNVTIRGESFGATIIQFNNGPFGLRAEGAGVYNTGTVSAVKGSNIVTGTNTEWLSNLTPQHTIVINDGVSPSTYGVASVESDTEIILDANYFGDDVVDVFYDAAIYVQNIIMEDLVVKAPDSTAIYFDHADLCFLEKISIPGPGVHGLHLKNCLRQLPNNIQIDLAGDVGLLVEGGYSIQFNNSFITNCLGHGSYWRDVIQTNIVFSYFNNNAGEGLLAQGGNTNVNLLSNAANNGLNGFSYIDCPGSGALGSGCFNNLGSGTFVSTDQTALIFCLMSGNGDYAVNIDSGEGSIIVANNLVGNSPDAVRNAGTGSIIKHNTGVPDEDDTSTTTLNLKKTPLESPNGSRTSFTCPEPYIGGSLVVSLNGLEETITETGGATFSFAEAPLTGDVITLIYKVGSSAEAGFLTYDTIGVAESVSIVRI